MTVEAGICSLDTISALYENGIWEMMHVDIPQPRNHDHTTDINLIVALNEIYHMGVMNNNCPWRSDDYNTLRAYCAAGNRGLSILGWAIDELRRPAASKCGGGNIPIYRRNVELFHLPLLL